MTTDTTASDSQLHMRDAVASHKRGDFTAAATKYRAASATEDRGLSSAAAILLANLLISGELPNTASATAEADALADGAVAHLEAVPSPKQRAVLLARYGYYQLQCSGATRSGWTPALAAPGSRLARAVAALERAVTIDPSAWIAWRNLTVAYQAADRLVDAEAAAARAVDAAGGAASAPVELLYRHAKALKRVKRDDAAAGRFADILQRDPADVLAAFWLRVLLLPASGTGETGLKAATRERGTRVLLGLSEAGGVGCVGEADETSRPPLVPHVYIARLFDGYAAKFDDHLVNNLEYKTPAALLRLALSVAQNGGGLYLQTTQQQQQQQQAQKTHHQHIAPLPQQQQPPRLWSHVADLGCGTGLAGAAFRPFMRENGALTGCDLSPLMCAEARKRTRASPISVAIASGSGGAPAALSVASTLVAVGGGAPADPISSELDCAATLPAPVSSVYDSVDAADIVGWLQTQQQQQQHDATTPFDLVICADVLVYIGDLSSVFSAAAAVTAEGALFVCSTEALQLTAAVAAAAAASGPLSGSGTHAHSATTGPLSGTICSPELASASGTHTPSAASGPLSGTSNRSCSAGGVVLKTTAPALDAAATTTRRGTAPSSAASRAHSEAEVGGPATAPSPAASIARSEVEVGGPAAAPSPTGAGPDFVLNSTGRVSHSRRYVERVAAAAGWERVAHTEDVIRQNGGRGVIGDLFVFRRAG